MAKKIRLDQLLVQRGLAETRSKAQALIMAGTVRVAGTPRSKAGELVPEDVEVSLAESLPYVSRGGYKLAHALDTFALTPAGLVALDIGASTGGFTDVLLQRGAARVYAVDVGYGQLDWRLRQDPRVVAVDRTNIRYLEALPGDAERPRTTDHGPQTTDHGPQTTDHGQRTSDEESPEVTGNRLEAAQEDGRVLAACVVIDTSFISLRLVLPAAQRLMTPDAWVVALIKPQFEAGQHQVGKGGVVRDSSVHRAVVRDIVAFAQQIGLAPHGLARSPITGPAGNIEFLAWLGGPGPNLDLEQALADIV